MALLLFALVLVGSLLIVPLGLPGAWIMLAAALAYDLLLPDASISWIALGTAVVLAVVAEVLEYTLSLRYTRRYGGSRRAGWGAVLGGLAGAIIGVPVPLLGSLLGAFAGAFLGALVAEYSRREATAAGSARVATGALLGRVAAAAVKTALAMGIAVILIFAAWRGAPGA